MANIIGEPLIPNAAISTLSIFFSFLSITIVVLTNMPNIIDSSMNNQFKKFVNITTTPLFMLVKILDDCTVIWFWIINKVNIINITRK
jgi:hypothetical protein